MENLNKENFWNEMEEKFPTAMHVFYGWIDLYKEEVKWDELFGEDILEPVKFHDIPFDMQVGILMRFSSEIFHGSKPKVTPEDIMPMVRETMEKLDISARMRTQFRSEN